MPLKHRHYGLDKNWLKIYQKFYAPKFRHFKDDLVEICSIFNLELRGLTRDDFQHDIKNKELTLRTIEARKRLKRFVKSLTEAEQKNFSKRLSDILSKYELGAEWFLPLTDYLVSGFLYPPFFNLDITTSGPEGKQRVVIILNPDTSQDDFRDAWETISWYQQLIWPLFEKTYVRTSSYKNLEIATKDYEMRQSPEIDVLNTEKGLYEKAYLTDSAIVAEIFSDEEDTSKEADASRRAKLRQIRFKNKPRP